MPILVTSKDDVKISDHDKELLRSLEIDSVDAIHRDGSSTSQVFRHLQEAFRLGFTAVNRGEAEGQAHPPLPDFMTDLAIENENRFFREVGTQVEWSSQSKGHVTTKTGVIVDVIAPNQKPSDLKWPSLYKRNLGQARKGISYVVLVAPPAGSAAQPKYYWPLTTALKQVAGA